MAAMRTSGLVVCCALVAAVLVLGGCTGDEGGTPEGANTPARGPRALPAEESADEPQYTSWRVYINDDDSYQDGGITYTIALNLTATHEGAEPTGDYSGKATAKTDSVGEYQGQQLNASAIAKSSNLEFALEDPTASGDLAALTDDRVLSGSGSIAMSASGSGTYGQAGGGFGKNSREPIKVSVSGSEVTLEVPISGHTYTFTGTLIGE